MKGVNQIPISLRRTASGSEGGRSYTPSTSVYITSRIPKERQLISTRTRQYFPHNALTRINLHLFVSIFDPIHSLSHPGLNLVSYQLGGQKVLITCFSLQGSSFKFYFDLNWWRNKLVTWLVQKVNILT